MSMVNNRPHSSSMLQNLLDENSSSDLKPLLESKDTPKGKTKSYHFWHLFSTKKLTLYTITMAFCWFTASNISYGMNLHIGEFFGNPYLVLGLLAASGWLACVLASILDHVMPQFGRKTTLNLALFADFACFLAITISLQISNATPSSGLSQSMTYVAVIGYAIDEVVWLGCYQFASELFPTVIRNMAGGFSSSIARIGAIVSPYVMTSKNLWPPLPYAIFAWCIFISFVSALILLPETKNKNLPENLKEDTFDK